MLLAQYCYTWRRRGTVAVEIQEEKTVVRDKGLRHILNVEETYSAIQTTACLTSLALSKENVCAKGE